MKKNVYHMEGVSHALERLLKSITSTGAILLLLCWLMPDYLAAQSSISYERYYLNGSQTVTGGDYIQNLRFGSGPADGISFYSNAIKQMTLRNDKLGIGRDDPAFTLDVNGLARFYRIGNATSFFIGGDASTGGYTNLTLGTSSNQGGYAFLQGIKSSGSQYGDLILNLSGGNVGIGTSTPGYKLAVNEVTENTGLSRRNLNPALDQVNGASANPTDATTSGNLIEYRLRSFFGRANYSYKDRYLFEANVRYDGTSRFPAQNRFQAFPSVSIGWRLSEEDFFHLPFVAGLKVRASWGKLGNQEIGDYSFINKVDFNSTSAIIGGQQVSGATEAFQLANEIIRWETTTSSNIGIDAEFFEGSLTFSGDYFNKSTDDILLTVEQPRILGASPPVANVGSVVNSGFEISLGFKGHIGEFKYGINGNLSKVSNEVTSLGDEDVRIVNGFRYEKGKSVSNIYGFVSEGLFRNVADVSSHADQSQLGGPIQPGDIKYKDLNNDGIIDNDDRTDLGSYFPSVNYGLSLTGSMKNFDFSMLWQGVGCVEAYVTGTLARPFLLSNSPLEIQYQDRAQINDNKELINSDAKFPRTLFSSTNNYTGEIADGRANSFFVKNTGFLKLRNVQVGYSVPSTLLQKFGLSRLRAYVSIENLVTLSKFNYYQIDPEIPSTGDPVPSYPTVKSYSIGLNVNF